MLWLDGRRAELPFAGKDDKTRHSRTEELTLHGASLSA